MLEEAELCNCCQTLVCEVIATNQYDEEYCEDCYEEYKDDVFLEFTTGVKK